MAEKASPQPEARVVRSRAALAEAVARWPASTYETTWALVAVSEIATAPQLAALRKAAKTCDKVAAVVIPAEPKNGARALPNVPTMLRAAGCDVVWMPSAEKPLTTLQAQDGSDMRVMLQAVLAVLPSHVFVGRAESTLTRLWRLLANEYGDVVDVVFVT